MNRKKGTSADLEARSYEENGISPEKAWELVIKNFNEKNKDKTREEFELLRIGHFEVIGMTF